MGTPTYIKSLLRPNGSKPAGRKVWSVDLESVWIPFFTATNTEGITAIPNDAIGAPLRLAYNPDGSVKFNERTGKPVIKVQTDIAEQVKLIRENFVATLQQYAGQVQTQQKDKYIEQVKLNHEAGTPIIERDKQALDSAIEERILAQMEAQIAAETAESQGELAKA
jgi:hypothetical protein